jgi:hypothetical protein
MKRIAAYIFPLIILALFIAVMQGGYFYLTPSRYREEFPRQIKVMERDVNSSRWEAADNDLSQLEKTWQKIVPGIQFHAEKDAIDGIKINLGRLDGIIQAKDKGCALAELGEINEHWHNLTK